jgi:pantothenate kinase type III
MPNNIIAADFGNSRLKLLVDNNLHVIGYNEDWLKKLDSILDNHRIIFYSSVNEKKVAEASSFFVERKEFIDAGEELVKEDLLKYTHIDGIGNDRVFGLIGTAELIGKSVITIDCGTATTINVAKDGICLGGSIMPGLKTQLNSLNLHAEALQKFDKLDPPTVSCGTNTQEAISIGIIRGSIGAIKEIIGKVIDDVFDGSNPKIVVTGGNGEIIHQELREWNENIEFDDKLVLRGIRTVVKQLSK